MAIIEFMKDTNGEKQVLTFLYQLEALAKKDSHFAHLYKLVIRGLQFLEKHGLPRGSRELFASLQREDESPYTIRIIKELKHHPPLYEFRVNWQGAGAFRSILFEFEYLDQQVLFFTKAIIKSHTHSSEFEQLILESKTMFDDFQKNPHHYVKGVDENE